MTKRRRNSHADSESNSKMHKALLALTGTLARSSVSDDEALAIAQDFTAGEDGMRTFRLVYVAGKFVRHHVALSSVSDLMENAVKGVEAALSVPAATVAVQPEELSDVRAQALAQGATPDIPDAPRTALSGLLRGRIEDLAMARTIKPCSTTSRATSPARPIRHAAR